MFETPAAPRTTLFMLFRDAYIDDLHLVKSISSWFGYVSSGAYNTLLDTFALGLLKQRCLIYGLVVHNSKLKNILWDWEKTPGSCAQQFTGALCLPTHYFCSVHNHLCRRSVEFRESFQLSDFWNNCSSPHHNVTWFHAATPKLMIFSSELIWDKVQAKWEHCIMKS